MTLRMNFRHAAMSLFIMAAATVAGVADAVAQVKPDHIVVATWGGVWGEALHKSVSQSFEKKYGIKVVYVRGSGDTHLAKMRAEREHPRIDVAQFNNPYAIRAWEEGLIAELQPSEIPNLDRLHEWGKIKAGGKIVAAAMYMIDLGIAYRTDKIKRKITSWNDLWDPAFKRRVGLNDITNFGGRTLVLAAKLAGGDERNIEPGFKNLNRLGGNLRLLYPNPQLMDKGLASGEVWIGAYFYSAADRLRKEGKPIAYVAPKEGVVGSQDVFVLVKNGPNSQWAAKYIDMALGPEAQRTHTELMKLIPANREVPVSAEAAARVKGAMLFDDAYITGQFAGWKSRWDREIIPLLE